MQKIFFFLFFSSLLACRSAQKPPTKWLDIAYANTSAAQKMDIFLPEKPQAKNPVIIHIHGGAFQFGDKADKQVAPVLEALKYGYAVVSINYRLSGEAKFPAQIQDVKAAIRFLRANADKFQLKTDKIAAWGGSAGGHLSALAGTSGEVSDLEDLSLGNPTQSSRIQAVVDWFGPINFLTMDAQFKASGKGNQDHNNADSPESKLWGKPIQEIPDSVKKANPETYISSDDAVFFIQHGSNDKLVPTQQSMEFVEKLTPILGKENVMFEVLEGANHGGPDFETPENIKKVMAFLEIHLK
ncbi:MAG: alpha/beta hydrolase [Bacteroidota bacterium]